MDNIEKKVNELGDKISKLSEPEKSIFNEIINLILDLSKRTSSTDSEISKTTSLVSFLKQKGLDKSHAERVIGMAYYLDKYKGIDPFNVKDIEKTYEEARIKPPKNLTDIVSKQAKRRELLIEAKEKKDGLKSWRISANGIDYVESLSGE